MASIAVKAFNGTPEQREIARDVVRWFASQGRPIRRNIQVNVHFVDYLEPNESGDAKWVGRNSYQATKFTIRVNTNIKQRKILVKTLCHEMVHVRQMAHRRLLDRLEVRRGKREYRTIWVGQDKTRSKQYENQPWEKEAWAMEGPLADRFYAYIGWTR